MDIISNTDLDLSSVEIGQPIIDNQLVLCRTGEVKWDTEKDRLVIPLVLEEPATSTTGRELTIGFKTTLGINCKTSEKFPKERVLEELAKFQVAVLKLERPEKFGDPGRYSGQLVKVRFSKRDDKKDPTKVFQDGVFMKA